VPGRSTASRVLVVIGGLLAALSTIAGHVNREVFDGAALAHNVDEIRRDDAVAQQVGIAISDALIRAKPDLVALGPLVQQVSINVAGGDLLSRPVQSGVQAAYSALIDGDDSIVLRLADVGAVVTAVLATVAPDRAPVSSDVSVTLATLGTGEPGDTLAWIAHYVQTLAWMLPLATLMTFAAAVWLSRDRWWVGASIGRALVWAAVGVGVLLAVGGFLVRRMDSEELAGALAQAAWGVMVRPLWWGVAIVGAIGALVALACRPIGETVDQRVHRLRSVVSAEPHGAFAISLRAVLVAALGIAAIVDPIGVIEPVITLAGATLVVFGALELLRVLAEVVERRSQADEAPAAEAPVPTGRGRRVVARWVLGGAAVVLVGLVVLEARPGSEVPVAAAVPDTCNGHVELCERTFDDVAYAASHNSMSVAGAPGWFIGEQADPIPTQLDQGVRALLIDVWSGQPTSGSTVRTAASSYQEALDVASADFGPEVVDAALRIANSVAGPATGPEARYMCHGLCEIGSTPFKDMLAQLRGWLAINPGEVVTLFVEDHVDADLIAADVESSGLLPYVYQPEAGQPWPTLREMIDSNQRLVVMVEEGTGGDAAPWLVNGFEFTQDTPYTFPTAADFSCDPNRGPSDAPLFLLNHWLSGFGSLVTNAQHVNRREVLLPRAEQCESERGQVPNFVAVNFVSYGDVFDVVDTLNGVSP
jgi:hypothetical protein